MYPNQYGSQYGSSKGYGQQNYPPQGDSYRSQHPLVYPSTCIDSRATSAGSYVLGDEKSSFQTVQSGIPSKTIPIPTLRPNMASLPHMDIIELKRAFEGAGCDEKVVIEILCRRSSLQREKIKNDYIKEYGKSLNDRLKKELFQPLDKIMRSLLYIGPDLDAYILRKATKGPVVDIKVIAHIMVTRSYMQICQIKESYSRQQKSSLIDVFHQKLNGKFRDTILYLANNQRFDADGNRGLASEQAIKIFHLNNFHNPGIDPVMQIFCQSSYHQIVYTAVAFEETYRQTLEEFLASFGGDFENLLLSICSYSLNPNRFFAKELKQAILEHNLQNIIMIVCTRCEVDLGNILAEYQNLYGNRAEYDIQSSFQAERSSIDALMILMGNN